MVKSVFIALSAVLAVAPAAAQAPKVPVAPSEVQPFEGSGVTTPQSNSTGDANVTNRSPTGQPADVISSDSAAAGNAGQPERVAPQGGGGGSN